jgi:hypothetical protein
MPRSLASRLAAFLLPLAALASATPVRAQDDAGTLAAFRLSDAGLAKFVAATRGMAAAVQRDTALAGQLAEESRQFDSGATIAAIAAVYDRHPAVSQAFAAAGTTSREYVTFMLATLQSGLAAALVQRDSTVAGHLPPGISRENVEFYRRHEAELARLGEEMRALSQRRSGEAPARASAPATKLR